MGASRTGVPFSTALHEAWQHARDDWAVSVHVERMERRRLPRLRVAWWSLSFLLRFVGCHMRGHPTAVTDGWAGPDSGGEDWSCPCGFHGGRHVYY